MTKKKKHKNLYLDTNILLNNPSVLDDFTNSQIKRIFISDVTLRELDEIKKQSGEKGRSAREVIRNILKIIENKWKINNTQELCFTEVYEDTVVSDLTDTPVNLLNNDDRIIAYLAELDSSEEDTLFLTFDNIAYIKAVQFIKNRNLKHVNAELFNVEKTDKKIEETYTGRKTIYANPEVMSLYNESGFVAVSDCYIYNEKDSSINICKADDFVLNQFIIIKCPETNSSMLGYFDGKTIKKLLHEKETPYGVKPKNVGQIFLQEALMRDVNTAPLVICKGPAGTAKTFYSVAVGLNKVMESGEFKKILCCRPNVQMDEDIGFLPGDEKDKIAPYFRPIVDNLEALSGEKNSASVHDLISFGHINFEAVAFMRGRSIVKTYIIVDEAQNLTITQVKGIITRAGKDTKVILVGDPDQIDNPLLDKYNNGLSYASNKMKGSKYCWQITMDDKEGVRSNLATEAASRL